jgi:hypothetical protein
MTDKNKTGKAKKQVKVLNLNRETIQDLTEQESDQARGGLIPRTQRVGCAVCTYPDTGCD